MRIHYSVLINNPQKIEIGDNVSISGYGWLNCTERSENAVTLKIGAGCFIGRFSHINAFRCVAMEDNVLVGERVHITDATHKYHDSAIPIIHQGEEFKGPVLIQKGAWLGSGSVIMPGVSIGRNAVVGANAVVTQDVPDNFIARGVPAKMFPKK